MNVDDAYAALADAITVFWLARDYNPVDLPMIRQRVHTAHRDYRDAKRAKVPFP